MVAVLALPLNALAQDTGTDGGPGFGCSALRPGQGERLTAFERDHDERSEPCRRPTAIEYGDLYYTRVKIHDCELSHSPALRCPVPCRTGALEPR